MNAFEHFRVESVAEMESGSKEWSAAVRRSADQRGLELTPLVWELIEKSYLGGFADGGKFALLFVDQHREHFKV